MRAAIFILAAALCACAAPAADNRAVTDALPAPTASGVVRHITAADDGKTISVAVGARFQIELIGVMDAGYVWSVVEKPAFLTDAETATGDTVAQQKLPGYAGGNNWETFAFKATQAGAGRVRLEQRRPWEKTEPPAKTFEVTIDAK